MSNIEVDAKSAIQDQINLIEYFRIDAIKARLDNVVMQVKELLENWA